MPLYMLDTDISSYIMKRSNQSVLDRLRTVSIEDTCISAITKSELMYGIEVSPRHQHDKLALDALLRFIDVVEYNEDTATHYAEIRAYLKRQGTMIGANDLFIAAHARSLNLILVTNNTREFSRVPELRLENWTESSPGNISI